MAGVTEADKIVASWTYAKMFRRAQLPSGAEPGGDTPPTVLPTTSRSVPGNSWRLPHHSPTPEGTAHCRRGTLARGGFPSATLAICARSLPFRSPQTTPRSTGRFVEPPASPRVPRYGAQQPQEEGRSETGLQESIPVRSRHSRAAASAPASLPSLTVPQRVRFGRAPRRKRRIDPLGARPLRQRTPGDRPHCAPSPSACCAISALAKRRPLAAIPLDATHRGHPQGGHSHRGHS